MKKKIFVILLATLFFTCINNASATCTRLTAPNGTVSYTDSKIENWMSSSGYKVESVDDNYCTMKNAWCYYESDDSSVKLEFEVEKHIINKNNGTIQYRIEYATLFRNETYQLDTVRGWYHYSYGYHNIGSIDGADYYKSNKKCPDHAFVFDRKKSLDSFDKKNNILFTNSNDLSKLSSFLNTNAKNSIQLTLKKQIPVTEDTYELGECYYYDENNPVVVALRLDINSLKNKPNTRWHLSEIGYLGNLEKIQNWNTNDVDGFDFKARRFIDQYKTCPNYSIVVHHGTSYELYLSNKETCTDLIEKFKNKYSNFSECFTYPYTGVHNAIEESYNTIDYHDDNANSCFDYGVEDCEINTKFSCSWVKIDDDHGYCNVNKLQYIKCGGAFDIPEQAPGIISFVINLLKIGTPIILIIVGLVTLVKALAASKEDEIKKAQTSLIKKMIAAAFVFFVVAIVQFVILKVADDDETGSISSCLSCFLNNDCDTSKYFKDKVGDKYVCHYVNNPTDTFTCDDDAD